MKVLLLGAQGMLGQALATAFDGDEVTGWDKAELDITDASAVRSAVVGAGPDLIVNAAAYTDVDGAENDRAVAFAVNEVGARNVGAVAKDLQVSLVHFSTDYVFPGDSEAGYAEDDSPGPAVNVYGESKLAGERALRELGFPFYLMRTAWLYGPGGNNFVDTMLGLAQEQREVRVVNDQFGSPTYTVDLARAVRDLVKGGEAPGIYHLTNAGMTSWYEFAHRIFREAGLPVAVLPTDSSQFERPARRPSHSVLRSTKGPQLRSWQEALHDYIATKV